MHPSMNPIIPARYARSTVSSRAWMPSDWPMADFKQSVLYMHTRHDSGVSLSPSGPMGKTASSFPKQ